MIKNKFLKITELNFKSIQELFINFKNFISGKNHKKSDEKNFVNVSEIS